MADYLDVEEARGRKGLRLVLTVGGPGPWSEAAKGFFHVKRVPFARVAQLAGEPNEALREWTGQTAAPVAAWDDEPPLHVMSDILWLAERLAPDPPLVPADPHERVLMSGLAFQITGRMGLGWCRRLMMLGSNLDRQAAGPAREQSLYFARKYGLDAASLAAAPDRIVEILELLAEQLHAQQGRGERFLVGDHLTAVDILWATFATMFDPLPHELCAMPQGLRRLYTVSDPRIRAALDPALLAHRDRIYEDFLELPLDF